MLNQTGNSNLRILDRCKCDKPGVIAVVTRDLFLFTDYATHYLRGSRLTGDFNIGEEGFLSRPPFAMNHLSHTVSNDAEVLFRDFGSRHDLRRIGLNGLSIDAAHLRDEERAMDDPPVCESRSRNSHLEWSCEDIALPDHNGQRLTFIPGGVEATPFPLDIGDQAW